jgi:hypothetical protein
LRGFSSYKPFSDIKMDADTLRLTLMVLGAGLILGIYLWEKRKHSQSAEQEEERLEPTLKTMDETLVEPAMPDPPAGQQSVGAAAPAGVLHEPSAPQRCREERKG